MSKSSYDQPRAIGRRRFLRLAALAFGGAALVGLGGRPAAAQQSKQAAGYQNAPNGGQRCADCRYFRASSRTCQLVAGEISPNGWCRFFARVRTRGGY
jgi:hypothetical protein